MNDVSWPDQLSGAQRRLVADAAQWARLAYADARDMDDGAVRVDCPACDAHGLITFPKGARMMALAVRGTTSLTGVLVDIEVAQTPLDDDRREVLVHTGFHRQFKALCRETDAHVIRHLKACGSHTLLCTGHSLGAGVAALLAVHYGTLYPGGRVAYVGYGSPRQGNAAFAERMTHTTSMAVCVKNGRDPVCALIPPIQYQHAGQSVHIGSDPRPNVPDPLFLRDHDIRIYVEHLTANLHRSTEGPMTAPDSHPSSPLTEQAHTETCLAGLLVQDP